MTYIKLVGKERTCTNYARVFLEKNFPGVRVLVNVLGWKHGWIEGLRVPERIPSANDNWTRFSGEPYRDSGENWARVDVGDLRAACENEEVCVAVCTKHPRVAVQGALDHRGLEFRATEFVREYCEDYNLKYSHWLYLTERRGRAVVISHDALLKDAWGVACEVAAVTGLGVPACVLDEPRIVKPVTDMGPYEPEGVLFDRESYLSGRRFSRVPHEVQTVVRDVIDWKLMAELGYYESLDPYIGT